VPSRHDPPLVGSLSVLGHDIRQYPRHPRNRNRFLNLYRLYTARSDFLRGETDPRSSVRLLLAHSERENQQSGHRQMIALIYQAARAEFFDDYRIVISQSSAAE
jgi:hypothetical protein